VFLDDYQSSDPIVVQRDETLYDKSFVQNKFMAKENVVMTMCNCDLSKERNGDNDMDIAFM
jgi:hypothetical protein